MLAEISQRDYELLHEFRRSLRRYINFSENNARNAGIDPQQHQLLLTVRAVGPVNGVSVGDIAERLQLRHHSVVELVDRAVEHGLVRRERSSADRRRVNVRLTDDGRAMLARLSSGNLAELRAQAPTLVTALQHLLASRDEPEAASGDPR